jgi:hypothetical protein
VAARALQTPPSDSVEMYSSFQTLWIAKPLIVLGLANLELQLASFSHNRPA